MSVSLEGKVALVTGSGAGMGRASAKMLSEVGARVVVVDWDEEAALATRQQIVDAGGIAASFIVDASTEVGARSMIDFAISEFGRLDILHNQLFAIEAGLIEDITPTGWNLVLQSTLTATFLAMKYALPVMKAQESGGSIINTASISGIVADPGLGAYGAAKAGVIALTKYGAIEYGEYGIRVNAISPGIVETESVLQTFGEARTATILRTAQVETPVTPRTTEELAVLRRGKADATALKRIPQPEEIAGIVVFLASSAASSITGANIIADAGTSQRSASPSMIKLA
jgi:NAD(P)-dependent dehydrogenase (short-subunit alcohol dehydrogenase family)